MNFFLNAFKLLNNLNLLTTKSFEKVHIFCKKSSQFRKNNPLMPFFDEKVSLTFTAFGLWSLSWWWSSSSSCRVTWVMTIMVVGPGGMSLPLIAVVVVVVVVVTVVLVIIVVAVAVDVLVQKKTEREHTYIQPRNVQTTEHIYYFVTVSRDFWPFLGPS